MSVFRESAPVDAEDATEMRALMGNGGDTTPGQGPQSLFSPGSPVAEDDDLPSFAVQPTPARPVSRSFSSPTMLGFLKGLSAKTAVVAALVLSTAAEASTAPVYPRDDKKWVSIWGTMPQLAEPHNLPPEPFVSRCCIRRMGTLLTGAMH